MKLLNEVSETLLRTCNFSKQDSFILGISGGPDSLCLFDILTHLDFAFTAAHLDHRLRPGSATEADRLKTLVESYGVPWIAGSADVRLYARENHHSLEEAARIVRYEFLFDLAQRENASAVLVAHQADDQVETILMHILRGSGLQGLLGMQTISYLAGFSQTIPLVRPLLAASRLEIAEYCDQNGLDPLVDESNLDPSLTRNRIRHELLPELETYNPRIREVILRMAQVLAGEDQILRKMTAHAWQEAIHAQGEGWLGIGRREFLALERGTQRTLIRRGIETLRSELQDIDFEATERAVETIHSPPHSGSVDLLAGLVLLVEGDLVWLTENISSLPVSDWPQLDRGSELELPAPGRVGLSGDWVLETELVRKGEVEKKSFPTAGLEYQARVDAARLTAPLVVRGRRSGDRFPPLGMDGRLQKLSDFMINEKIPRRLRAGWPLIFSGGELVWIPGYRISHLYQVLPETEHVLLLAVRRSSSSHP
jgi:tRNA(Ile)-lysidine synthase